MLVRATPLGKRFGPVRKIQTVSPAEEYPWSVTTLPSAAWICAAATPPGAESKHCNKNKYSPVNSLKDLGHNFL
ncbi:MAG: hypothetical protein METHP_01177 [Methanoregula sp. SKADARSKE-2]|nr:MAG: hypothetical protein METHP_01177 [Methanoregula sp. SKADARSKE-2]